MEFAKKILILALGVSQLAPALEAAGSNPYQKIGAHNLFGLQPSPPIIQTPATPPPQIVLNGITSIFGDKRALFKTLPTADFPKEQNYMLAEGQRAGEVELLSLDMKAGAATINNHGVIQVVTICKAPTLAWSGESAGDGGQNNFQNGTASQTTESQSQNAPGGQVTSQAGYQSGQANSQPGSSASDGTAANNTASNNADSNSSSGSSSTSNASAPKTDPWWITGSRAVEAARRQTADLVSSGQADPQPLTPLTPPGTPAYLIGSDQLFFDHM